MAELLPLYTFDQWQTSLYQLQDITLLLTSYCTHWVEKLSFLQRKDPTLNGKAMAPVYFQPMRGLVILYWTLSTNNNLAKISCKMAPRTTILLYSLSRATFLFTAKRSDLKWPSYGHCELSTNERPGYFVQSLVILYSPLVILYSPRLWKL